MKKLNAYLLAVALLLGMTQCKKEQPASGTTTDGGETVYITMKVDNGGRHIVYPGTGAVVYGEGDVIYVGNGGHYVGSLTYHDGAFSGNITSPNTADYLHFYFVGGQTPSVMPQAGSTTDFTVSIADQSNKLPVLSYGKSNTKYIDGNTTYTCMLENKCGLVKFTLANDGTNGAVTVAGMLTDATINFATPGITPAGTTGSITLYPETATEKWAILLPQNAVNSDITYNKSIYELSVPQIEENGYVTSGVSIGAQFITFSVSATEVVRFSPGNLQYKNGIGWRFAEHQYDCIYAWNTNDWVDLFGWGTWGQGKNPLNESTNNADYEWSTDFEGTINGLGGWRTLGTSEWYYLVNNRDDATNKRGMATVHGVFGGLILPDNFTMPAGITFIPGGNSGTANWTNNNYSDEQWSALEAAGVVFLPAVGSRNGTTFNQGNGKSGYYWSSSGSSDYMASRFCIHYASYIDPYGWTNRYYGYAVRLVR